MKNIGLISVIVPFYKSEKTIKRCVESITNQTYPFFELICVNDGGTDNSKEIVKSLINNDSRIVLLDETHSGVSNARNQGIKFSHGEFIMFVDSDDYIEKNMLEKMIKTINRNKADLVVCNYTHPSIKNYLGDCVLDLRKKHDLLKYCQSTFAMVVPWNKLYRKNKITNLYDSEVSFCEDDLFGYANLGNIKKIVSISDCLYHYYVAPSDTSLDDCSCINKIARDKAFWTSKNTYWYLRKGLLEKSLVYLKQYFDQKTANECAYARMFDFMLWELVILNQMGVNRQGLIYEMQAIFKEPEFLKSLLLKKSYGIKMLDLTSRDRDHLVEKFCNYCYMISDQMGSDSSFRLFYAYLYVFVNIFIERCGMIDSSDILAKAYIDSFSLSREALYAKMLVDSNLLDDDYSYAFS